MLVLGEEVLHVRWERQQFFETAAETPPRRKSRAKVKGVISFLRSAIVLVVYEEFQRLFYTPKVAMGGG